GVAGRAGVGRSRAVGAGLAADVEAMARPEVGPVVASPLDLHRYTMEFYGVTRSIRGAKDTREGDTGGHAPSFEQLVELGRSGDVNADDHHIVHIVDWLLQYAYEQRASDIHLEPRRELDRKSTRLNSSHVKISYAV